MYVVRKSENFLIILETLAMKLHWSSIVLFETLKTLRKCFPQSSTPGGKQPKGEIYMERLLVLLLCFLTTIGTYHRLCVRINSANWNPMCTVVAGHTLNRGAFWSTQCASYTIVLSPVQVNTALNRKQGLKHTDRTEKLWIKVLKFFLIFLGKWKKHFLNLI